MKLNKILKYAGLCCAVKASLINGASADPSLKEMEASKSEEKKVYTESEKKELLTVFGWTMGMQTGLRSLGFDSKELSYFMEGLQLAIEGKESPVAVSEIMPKLQPFLQEKSEAHAKIREAEVAEMSAKNKKIGEEFLVKLAKENPKVKKSATGLCYEILVAGNEKEKPTETDSVKINYVGTLIDGKVFDQSKNAPVTFPLQGVVPGLKEGCQLIGQGGKIKLYIPAALAYGDHDIPMIPPGSTLIFEIELLEIQKSSDEAEVSPVVDAENTEDAKTQIPEVAKGA